MALIDTNLERPDVTALLTSSPLRARTRKEAVDCKNLIQSPMQSRFQPPGKIASRSLSASETTPYALTSLLGGGLLGIYLLGFLTRRGDARAVWIGIACTATFTLWTMGLFPDALSVPFDLYYTSMIGNLVMFAIGFGAATLLRRSAPPADDLSLWGEQEET